MKVLAVFLLFLALILEVSITTIPLLLLVLLCLMVLIKANWLFILAFIFGLIFDLLAFKTLGTTSAFLLVVLFLVLLYQSKFEITTGYFVIIAAFLGSLLFLFIQGYTHSILVQAIVSSIIAWLFFKIMQKFGKPLLASYE
jgi:cell shape-determining protein MreD